VSLERELSALAPALDWPDAPDVTVAVAARVAALEPRPAPRRRLALALAVVAAALLAVLAVPPARTAIFDWLGIGSAQIVQVDELPTVPSSPDLDLLGALISLDQARDEAGFAFAEPPEGEPDPDEIRIARGRRVSYLWRDSAGIRLLITQFPGVSADPGLLKKLVVKKVAGGGTTIDQFTVDGDRAVWLRGGPHVVYVLARGGFVREDAGWLAGNTLLVDRDGVTVRIEGALRRKEAVELVRAMHR
jgi:hypothetical protein